MDTTKKTIRFVCVSDTHNKTDDLQVPEGDVLIHSGDFTNIGEPEDVEKFNNWLGSLPHPIKVVIAGNHEVTFDVANFTHTWTYIRFRDHLASVDPVKTKALLTNCIYLEDSSTVVHGYKIYGSPWSPELCSWGFNAQRGKELEEIWSKIPDDTEILITHGPPYGILDDDIQVGKRIGCEELLKAVTERVKPLYHIFGHVHEGYGIEKKHGITFVNPSILNEHYKVTNAPIVFELPIKKENSGKRNRISNLKWSYILLIISAFLIPIISYIFII